MVKDFKKVLSPNQMNPLSKEARDFQEQYLLSERQPEYLSDSSNNKEESDENSST